MAKTRVVLTVSIDTGIKENIEREHKESLVSKSVIVNEILKKHYEDTDDSNKI